MENDNKKILLVSFLTAGLLVFFVSGLLIDTFSATWGAFARLFGNELVKEAVRVVLGFGTFFALQFNSRVQTFADEVVVELKKIVWPSRKDTVAMTIVVCVMVVICGAIFSVFDALSGWAIGALPSWMNTLLK